MSFCRRDAIEGSLLSIEKCCWIQSPANCDREATPELKPQKNPASSGGFIPFFEVLEIGIETEEQIINWDQSQNIKIYQDNLHLPQNSLFPLPTKKTWSWPSSKDAASASPTASRFSFVMLGSFKQRSLKNAANPPVVGVRVVNHQQSSKTIIISWFIIRNITPVDFVRLINHQQSIRAFLPPLWWWLLLEIRQNSATFLGSPDWAAVGEFSMDSPKIFLPVLWIRFQQENNLIPSLSYSRHSLCGV